MLRAEPTGIDLAVKRDREQKRRRQVREATSAVCWLLGICLAVTSAVLYALIYLPVEYAWIIGLGTAGIAFMSTGILITRGNK